MIAIATGLLLLAFLMPIGVVMLAIDAFADLAAPGVSE